MQAKVIKQAEIVVEKAKKVLDQAKVAEFKKENTGIAMQKKLTKTAA